MPVSLSKYTKSASQYMEEIYGGVRGNFDRLGKELVSLPKAYERLDEIKKDLHITSFKNVKILEVGSGFGVTLFALGQDKAKCYGIEPDVNAYKVSKEINKEFIKSKVVDIQEGIGEKLPYKNNMFDLVISFQVLEHVQDPYKVVSEAVRVLKPGGHIYFVIPNYNSFWEGHYEVFWFPNLLNNKFLAKLYLKLFYGKKDLQFLETLNNITPELLKKITSKIKQAKLISLGEEKFTERLQSTKYSPKWGGTSKLIALKNAFQKLKITKLLASIFTSFGWQLPIIFIVKKK